MSKIFNASNVLRVLGMCSSIMPIVFRDNMSRILDNIIYMLYKNDVCEYIAADDRYTRVVITSIILFFIIFMISFAFLKIANRLKPRLLNICLMIICALLCIFASMNVPHHYYRLNPDGYKLCE